MQNLLNELKDILQHHDRLVLDGKLLKNKIGLGSVNSFLSKNKEVVLAWPYKDCILEGGQSKEESKRNEIFFNEVMAPEQIGLTHCPTRKLLSSFRTLNIFIKRQLSMLVFYSFFCGGIFTLLTYDEI